MVREYWAKAYENNTKKELQYEPTAVLSSLPTKTNASKRITLKELVDLIGEANNIPNYLLHNDK